MENTYKITIIIDKDSEKPLVVNIRADKDIQGLVIFSKGALTEESNEAIEKMSAELITLYELLGGKPAII